MKKVFSRLISVLLIICCFFSVSSCAKKTRYEGRYAYTTSEFTIPEIDDCYSEIVDISVKEDNKYVLVNYVAQEVDVESDLVLYTLNEIGEIVDSFSVAYEGFETNSIVGNLIGDCYGFVTPRGKLRLVNLEDGSLEDSIDISNDNSFAVEETEDGFIVLSSGYLIRYFSDESEPIVVESDALYGCYGDAPLFESNGNYYVISYADGGLFYYQIDFDKHSLIQLENAYSMTDAIYDVYGEYIHNYNGIYRVDLENKYLNIIALWSDLNIRPENKALSNSEYKMQDDNHFAKVYTYLDDTKEIIFFTYDSTIDYSNCKLITIGGYGLYNDLALSWAIYNYNMSQSDYRVVCDDYSVRFPYSTGVEAQAQYAALLQYFEEGNSPDIFYGSMFDYENFGKQGIVIDLKDYYENDFSNSNLVVLNNISNENMYSVFSGYMLTGYWANSDLIPETDISYVDLHEYSENTGILPFMPISSANIADFIIRYKLSSFVSDNNNHVLSIEELTEIIEFSIEYGLSYESAPNFGTLQDVCNKQILTYSGYVSDIYTFADGARNYDNELSFIGYPSIDSSAHVIYPSGLVAVSSSSMYQDECWNFIKCLFDEDVQRVLAVNRIIPVNMNILEEFVSYCVNPDSVQISSVDYSSYTCFYDYTVDECIAENYMNSIRTADTVLSYDWGIYNIICDEVNSYYLMGKDPEEIAVSLQSRLDVYVNENY